MAEECHTGQEALPGQRKANEQARPDKKDQSRAEGDVFADTGRETDFCTITDGAPSHLA